MRKVVRLTESDLVRIVKRVIKENKRFGSFDDEEWYDDTDRLTSKDDFDFDYDEEEFNDFDSYHGKYPLDSEDSPSWFKSNNKDYSKSMFDIYKDKHKKPFKVRTKRD